jgi:hypothetical protein
MPRYRIEIDRRPIQRLIIEIECKPEELTHGNVFGDKQDSSKLLQVWDAVYPDQGQATETGIQAQFITAIYEVAMLQVPKDIYTTQPKYKFGRASLERLETCHPHLQLICRMLANYQDTSILCGHRGRAAQNAAYPKYSKVQWPNSKHNSNPSVAVDISPWPINWEDVGRFRVQAGRFIQIADMLEIPVRWGGDFNGDGLTNDRFIDLPHFELQGDGIADDVRHLLEGDTT